MHLKPHHTNYRSDIDGLRAIAVISVVVYHAFPNFLSGGFIGVDVFFVISGYLITSIIFQSFDNASFSFAGFYSRRIRRIFPALVVVMAVCYVFGWFSLLDDEYQQLGKHIAAGSLFISNFVLMDEVDYFDNSSETKPLLHLWSLGIEEQFYIVWPILIWFFWKTRFNFLTIIVVIIGISFYLNIKGIKEDVSATFYSPHTRFWELLSGSLLAWISLYKKQSVIHAVLSRWLSSLIYKDPAYNKSKSLLDFCSFIGMSFLIYGLLNINSSLSFPGWWAIVPVLGASLLIYAGADAWVNKTILSNRISVWFGLISYPLYLWHWPLFSFAHILENQTPSVVARIFLIVISVILAWLTYKFIECPIRFGKGGGKKIIALIIIMCCVGLIGFYTYMKKGIADRKSVVTVAEINSDLKFEMERSSTPFCDTADYRKMPYCSNQDSPSIVLIGDSHAPRIYPGLKKYYEKQGVEIGLLGSAGCPPLLYVVSKDDKDKDSRHCVDRMTRALLGLIKDENVKEILLTSRGPLYLTGHGFGNISGDKFSSWTIHMKGQEPGLRSNEDVFSTALSKTINAFLKSGKKVTYLYDVPELGFDIKSCANVRPISTNSQRRNPCAVSKQIFLERNQEFRAITDRVFKKFPEVRIIDLSKALCDDNWCYGGKDNVLFYTDDDHLSHRGSEYVVKRLVDLKALGN